MSPIRHLLVALEHPVGDAVNSARSDGVRRYGIEGRRADAKNLSAFVVHLGGPVCHFTFLCTREATFIFDCRLHSTALHQIRNILYAACAPSGAM